MSGVSTLRRGVFHFSRLETAVLIMMIFFMMINRMIMRVMMIDMMIMIMLIIAWDGFTQQNWDGRLDHDDHDDDDDHHHHHYPVRKVWEDAGWGQKLKELPVNYSESCSCTTCFTRCDHHHHHHHHQWDAFALSLWIIVTHATPVPNILQLHHQRVGELQNVTLTVNHLLLTTCPSHCHHHNRIISSLFCFLICT